MKRKNLYVLILFTMLVLVVSFGFLKFSDDDPTTAVAFSTIKSVEQPQSLDYRGSWSAGLNVPSPGGYGGGGVGYDRNDTSWVFCLNGDETGSSGAPGTFRKYNVTTNTWTNLTSNAGRCWTSVTKAGPVNNTLIYNLGGLPNGASAWTSMTGAMQSYNMNTNSWTTLASAPTPCGSSGFINYQDSLLYAVGGMGTTGQPQNVVQLYNITTNTWRAATVLPAARANGWVWIKNDTIYYGCGAGPTTATFNTTVYVGVISQADRANITWSTSPIAFPVGIHRCDAAPWGSGVIIGPGANAWWGQGNTAYTWMGGSSPFVSVGPVPTQTSDAMTGSVSFIRGNYRIWKFVIASGLILAAPYHILNTQIYTDSVYSPPPEVFYYNFDNGTTSNSFPLNQPAGKMSQTIVPANTFINPTPAPTGNITKLHFRIAATYPLGPATYNTFKIMLLHVPSEFVTPGSFITGAWDTVYKRDTITLQAAVNTWLEFPLDHPFAYNPTQPLAITMEQCGATGTTTGFSLRYTTATGTRRTYSVGGCPYVYSGASTNIINCGISLVFISGTKPISSNIPNEYSLEQNYPNPFNPTTKISYSIPKAGLVTLKIYNIIGQEVATLVNEVKSAGNYNVDFNGANLSSGVYFYKLESNQFSDVKRMMLIK